MSAGQPQVRFTGECTAPPEAVYDLLADLHSHLEWAGTGQSSNFRLLSMEAPAAAAAEGSRFASTGAIPMSARRWRDESVVTEAIRPSVFEFVTRATAGGTVARYRHRYQVAAWTSGSRVTYTMTQEWIERPMLRLGVPGLRTMMWRFAIPMFAGRGFRNLLATAAEMAPVRTSG
jgi:uncharacterized protein YndB with AHSA1/START domain